ncbi:hypothetical protein KPH14_012547 [Odynerus spinipes]|uniref:RDS/peripherin-like protein xRDS35 n=1 Tax=Odynerus spinipes TaxID=1348599 RepID=A0AAD9VMR3_9HYME|nr:hypothetical protein KPH14_012547 [Odynerus spinipes]
MSKNEWICDCDRLDPIIFKKVEAISCNCGWEVRFGYGVALTLAIFEVKRFFMLILEMIAEWQVIRFAGGLRPVVLTLLDVILGLPTAVLAIRVIRKYKITQCCSNSKRILRCLLLVIVTCVVLNIVTLTSIGYHINVKQETLANLFNASMHLYVNVASYKYTIDEIQFVFQCCGHTSYADWFLFDWQMVDYAPRDEMIYENRISDEEFRDRGVPFSCCSIRSMTPCVHAEMMDKDVKSINANGCAEVISPVLIRIVVIAYVMTSTLIVTQALLAFLIAKMIDRLSERMRFPVSSLSSMEGSTCLFSETTRGKKKDGGNATSAICRLVSRDKKAKRNERGTKTKRLSLVKRNARGKKDRRDSSHSSPSRGGSPTTKNAMEISEVARIKPSTHEEHRISRKRLLTKRIR